MNYPFSESISVAQRPETPSDYPDTPLVFADHWTRISSRILQRIALLFWL